MESPVVRYSFSNVLFIYMDVFVMLVQGKKNTVAVNFCPFFREALFFIESERKKICMCSRENNSPTHKISKTSYVWHRRINSSLQPFHDLIPFANERTFPQLHTWQTFLTTFKFIAPEPNSQRNHLQNTVFILRNLWEHLIVQRLPTGLILIF